MRPAHDTSPFDFDFEMRDPFSLFSGYEAAFSNNQQLGLYGQENPFFEGIDQFSDELLNISLVRNLDGGQARNEDSHDSHTKSCDGSQQRKTDLSEDSLREESLKNIKEPLILIDNKIALKDKGDEDDAEYKESSSEFDDPDETEKPRVCKEYKQRKDVVQKTILRKCRRFLQDEFNKITNYYNERTNFGANHLRLCINKFISEIDFFTTRQDLNLEFYLGNFHVTHIGAILYP